MRPVTPHTPAAPAAAPDWSQAPERSNAVALRVMSWIALRCGRRVARWVLHPITLYFVLFAPGPRRQSRRYLGRALGREAGWVDGYRQVFAFASTILDRVYFLGDRMDLFDVRVVGAEHVDTAIESGRGAFLVGAHAGSFEALHVVGRHRAGLRIAMVMYPDNARLINAALRAVAPHYQPAIIPLGRMDSMLAIRDWLDAGGLAGMLADRSLPEADTARSGHHTLSFLGKDALFADGPFRLALLLKRRVFFMAGIYLGGNRYEVRLEPLADFSTPSRDAADRERRVAEALRAYVQRLEALCREHPYNWFNFHDFWREDAA